VDLKSPSLCIISVLVILLAGAACSSGTRDLPQATPQPPGPTPSPTSIWSGLLQKTPYPYTTPLPPARSTILDGIYTQLSPGQYDQPPLPEGGTWMPHPVRRDSRWLMPPAPYPPAAGIWRLHLDKGIFRVFHVATGWRALGSYAVSGDRIHFFNDPHCLEDVGIYRWEVGTGQLIMEVIEDDCGASSVFHSERGSRARNLTISPWLSCQPPSTEAAISGHWPVPPGCEGDRLDQKD
jgi:hypothetical protein